MPYVSEFENVLVCHNSQGPRSASFSSAGTSSARPDGLFIHFPPNMQSRKAVSTRRRIRRLKETIAEAVIQAGMDSPPADEVPNPMEAITPRVPRGVSVVTAGPGHGQGSLFRGTYGQVVLALRSAGLVITPCADTGVRDGT